MSRQTDDKGVFCTDLSQEYQLAASTFGLTQEAVWRLSQQAIGYTFAPEPIKQRLEKKWAELKQQFLPWETMTAVNFTNTPTSESPNGVFHRHIVAATYVSLLNFKACTELISELIHNLPV